VRFILRLWLPDRPGALGRVASAIGSVGASLAAIDILEQEGGWAIDEIVVDAVDAPNAAEKLIAALRFVEGVNVEDIRETHGEVIDPRVDALETAAELVEQADAESLLQTLVQRAAHDMSADWAALMQLSADSPLASTGEVPSAAWIRAFVAGSRSSDALSQAAAGLDDIAWAELVKAEAVLVVGRDGRPFRQRERRQLAPLARIADRRWAELPS